MIQSGWRYVIRGMNLLKYHIYDDLAASLMFYTDTAGEKFHVRCNWLGIPQTDTVVDAGLQESIS